MKEFTQHLIATVIILLALPAGAAPRSSPRSAAAPRASTAGRAVGVRVVPHPDRPVHATTNPPHQVVYHNPTTNKDERHAVVIDHRPAHVIDRDPHLRVIARGYRSPRHWDHFHLGSGGWWRIWGITAWGGVGTVSCEAADEATGELFPVSADRDAIGWDDASIDAVLDQALDDCAAVAAPGLCVPATPACTFQRYE